MICSESKLVAKIALVILIIGFVIATVAIFVPYWNTQTENGTITYSGLLQTCQNSTLNCFSFDNLRTLYSGSEQWQDIVATLSVMLVGYVLMLVALIILIVYACAPNKILGCLVFFLCLLSALCLLAGMIVYGIAFDNISNLVLTWGFHLNTGGIVFVLAAGILILINTCLLP